MNILKRSIWLIAALCLFAATATSQLAIRPQVGINSPDFTEDLDGREFNAKLGYQFGGDLQLGDKVYLQPGLFFETLEGEFAEVGEIRVHRLRVPVMLGVRFVPLAEEQSFNVRAYTGPNVSLVVNKEIDLGIFEIEDDDMKAAVWGWNVGLGVDLGPIFIDAGYMFGLSEVFEDVNYDTRNNLFYANGGLRFQF